MSSKNRMLEARDLIQDEKYDEARAILVDIDHPTAREWLDKLNQVAPEAKATRNWGRIAAVMVVAVVVVGVIVIVMQSGGG